MGFYSFTGDGFKHKGQSFWEEQGKKILWSPKKGKKGAKGPKQKHRRKAPPSWTVIHDMNTLDSGEFIKENLLALVPYQPFSGPDVGASTGATFQFRWVKQQKINDEAQEPPPWGLPFSFCILGPKPFQPG